MSSIIAPSTFGYSCVKGPKGNLRVMDGTCTHMSHDNEAQENSNQ